MSVPPARSLFFFASLHFNAKTLFSFMPPYFTDRVVETSSSSKSSDAKEEERERAVEEEAEEDGVRAWFVTIKEIAMSVFPRPISSAKMPPRIWKNQSGKCD
jgi:hypothetical protein